VKLVIEYLARVWCKNIQEIENVIYKNFRRLADKISKDG
jgi:hypothetical protein